MQPPKTSVNPKPAKVPIPVGTDVALNLTTPYGRVVSLSYWDVWYALLAKNDFSEDLEQLGNHLRKLRGLYDSSGEAARKLSHLRDLQQRLLEAGLSLPQVLDAIPPELVKTEARRASGRILKNNERSYEQSEPMLYPPRRKLYGLALRGNWLRFPLSPEPYYKKLSTCFNWRKYHEEDASWGLARKLDAETECAKNLASQGLCAEALAVLRSIMTVAIELTTIADDSFGCIGMSFEQAFKAYLAFPRAETGISADVFFTDLLELLIFEDVGFTYKNTEGFFAGLKQIEGDFCLHYLRGRISALQALDLDYQAEQSLTLLGQVASEQKRFDQFESLAKEMQARAWKRIMRMVEAAEKAGKRELALSVFQKVLSGEEGDFTDFLTKEYHRFCQ